MTETCCVCNEIKKYPRHKDSYYICGSCVQLLLNTDKEILLQDYNDSIKDGDLRAAWALSMFLKHVPRVKLPRK